jgi:hypothetical protein
MAVISGWLGFLTGIRLQSLNYDPYAYGTASTAFSAWPICCPVVDREFRTTDVLIVLPVEAIKKPISSTSLWAGARRSSQSP